MLEKIQESVSVELVFNSQTKKIFPRHLAWRGKTYQIDKVGLHHFFRQGRTLFHVFSVLSGGLFFRLKLNTDNLHWTLEEIAEN
ncbi:hypothetical protein A2960_05100 [Candidatus Gottesmanbacteria bacterium RIFCSPLOWO2_01_FULL_39_12b]|uniref:Uncharacterized protein n=1 Tax=Candidatus Gottesmanbacteria bacterium RIFCSPLOWO2_01_FULL_39_12b TaxID=1798388 RepID=A0A1F6AMG8_9BACT|nr:MAG: hypothetical protein A2960_05100 [Candidatus Gottesmanbacteria bacterium RIFCSPLOWO2_01_FULL_39_12b]